VVLSNFLIYVYAALVPCTFFLSNIPKRLAVVSGFGEYEWGIDEILPMTGICERMAISIWTSKSSTSASFLFPSISTCTSAWAVAPAGLKSTDFTLMFSSLNFSSTILFTVSVILGFCHESTRIRDDCLSEIYDTENM